MQLSVKINRQHNIICSVSMYCDFLNMTTVDLILYILLLSYHAFFVNQSTLNVKFWFTYIIDWIDDIIICDQMLIMNWLFHSNLILSPSLKTVCKGKWNLNLQQCFITKAVLNLIVSKPKKRQAKPNEDKIKCDKQMFVNVQSVLNTCFFSKTHFFTHTKPVSLMNLLTVW